MDADGSNQPNITNIISFHENGPSWSWLVTKIAFTSIEDEIQIYIIEVKGD